MFKLVLGLIGSNTVSEILRFVLRLLLRLVLRLVVSNTVSEILGFVLRLVLRLVVSEVLGLVVRLRINMLSLAEGETFITLSTHPDIGQRALVRRHLELKSDVKHCAQLARYDVARIVEKRCDARAEHRFTLKRCARQLVRKRVTHVARVIFRDDFKRQGTFAVT